MRYYANFGGITFLQSWNAIEYKIFEEKITKSYIFLKIYNKNNELKLLYSNFSNNTEIEMISFEINKNGFGAGSIKFAIKPKSIEIENEDIVEIILDGQILYKGFINNDFDVISKEITLYPFLKRLQEWVYSGSFSNKTLKYITQSIITAMEQKTLIKYKDSFIDYGTDEPFSFEFKNETVFDILEKLVKLANNRYWNVDDNNYLHIREIKKNKIDKYFMLNTNLKLFSEINIRFDYSNIEATQYKVYKNNASGAETFVGEVGNSGNVQYPPLPVLEKLRAIQGVYTASEVISDSLALDIAYADLKNKAKFKQSINIKNNNLLYYKPKIDDYIYFEFFLNEKKESVGVTIDNTVNLVKIDEFNYQWWGLDNTYTWNSGSGKYYLRIYDIPPEGVYSALTLDGVDYIIESGAEERSFLFTNPSLRIRQLQNWEAGFSFELKKIKEDIGHLVDNVVKIKYKINKDNIKCDFSCGDLIEEEGEEFYKLKKKVRILETINKI